MSRPIDQSLLKRNQVMARAYLGGATLEAIGKRYGLTRERVRQIIRPLGVLAKDGGCSLRARVRASAVKSNKDARCLALHGCMYSQYRELLSIGRDMMASGLHRARTPIGAFKMQRKNARQRGIEWSMNLWQWWTIWQESGKWSGRGRGGYCMARFGDTGPYSVGNVYITTNAGNSSDQYLWRRHHWSREPQAV